MINQVLQQRIIETADEYHYIAEDQWAQAIDLAPESEDAGFEFRRLIRAALQFYARAFLALDLTETDAEQELEELFEIIGETHQDLADFFEKNDVIATLYEDATTNLSQVFSVAEAVRGYLLESSTRLAATLGTRFSSET
jgi:hypothetical protein